MHQQVFEYLRELIKAGSYTPGGRLPSEADLVEQFDTSRITVGRALRDLQQQGWIERRAGSGSFVRNRAEGASGRVFGLLIPELGQTEIFEPICQGMAGSEQMATHALLWGNSRSRSPEAAAWQLCEQFVSRKVSGVFFAPLEWASAKDDVNDRIITTLDQAGIPVVLLDREYLPYPRRSRYDLVGIDNRRAGFLITDHLLSMGSRKLRFVAKPGSAPTVDARLAGCREAILSRGIAVDSKLVHRVDPTDAVAVHGILAGRPDAIVCANDRTAGELMQTLTLIGCRVPTDIRIGGIDDVEYASLLAVPLTTVRQPCREIGEAAVATMLERVERPRCPGKEIWLDCHLVVRRSCGKVVH
jgi:GntR family transcriptional regulator of arabinose operon